MNYPQDFINKIICGDCLEVMKDIPDNSVDLVVTSPPYKNSYEGIGISRSTKTAKFHYSNDVGEPLYVIQDAADLIFQKLKVNGFFMLNLGYNKDSGALRPFYIVNRLLKKGWLCPEVIIWHKNNPVPNTAYQLTTSFEYVFILTKIPTYKCNVDKRIYVHNVWNIPINSEDTKHNAAFPLELPKRIIKLFSKEDDIILDPFAGIFTTCLAAKELKRYSIGIEINPEYCRIAEERLKKVPKRLDKFVNKIPVPVEVMR